MKKTTLMLTFILMAYMAYSQVFTNNREDSGIRVTGNLKSTDLISDFTITDSDGATWNLYELLDSGKTVFIDMFYSS